MTDNLPTPQRIFINQQRGGVQPTNVADVAPVVPAKRAKRCRPPPNGCGGLLAGPSGSELGCTCCSCPGCGKCTKIGTKQHLPTRCGEDRIGPCPEGKFVYQRCEGCNATQQALKRAKSKGNQQRLKELDMHSAAVAVEIPAQDEETAASTILALASPASSLPAGHSAALSSAMWTQLQERDHVDGAASAPAPGDAAAAVSAAEAASAASAAAISAAAATASTTITLASVPPHTAAATSISPSSTAASLQGYNLRNARRCGQQAQIHVGPNYQAELPDWNPSKHEVIPSEVNTLLNQKFLTLAAYTPDREVHAIPTRAPLPRVC